MHTKTLSSIGIAAAAVVLAASLVTAQTSGGGRGPGGGRLGPQGPGGRFGGGLAGLNLTEEQRTKVAALQRAGREQAAPVEEELRKIQGSLHREIFADARDAAKLAELSARGTTLQKQLADLHVKTATSLSDVLTAEQRATMREREGTGGGPGRGFGRLRHPRIAR